MELIIALLFFSLASTVCIRLFVMSHTLSSRTVDLNYAVTQAQNMAEAFLGCQGNLDQMMELFENSRLYDTGRGFQVEQGTYNSFLTLDWDREASDIIAADIKICRTDSEEVIYSLHVEHHIAERSTSDGD